MKKRFFTASILLCIVTVVFAQAGRYAVGRAIMKDPSILEQPWFWIAVVVCLVLVGIYAVTKDKE